MTQPTAPARIDVRTISLSESYALVFSSFAALGAGKSLELLNDLDLKPLCHEFDARLPGQFSWDYLDQGPTLWRVAITKIKPGHAGGRCCGSCGGA